MFTKQIAHLFWKELVQPGETVIDATCGNGYDLLFLSSLLSGKGKIYALDMQEEAIKSSKKRVEENLSAEEQKNISWHHRCHSSFPKEISEDSVALIVYNLGYLPGGNKSVTTLLNTTLKSVKGAMSLIKEGGCISITCYPGHPEGEVEENHLIHFSQELSPKLWSCSFHRWTNRKKAPSLLLIQKQRSVGS